MKVDINEVLNQIANAFNVTVEKVYPMLYKQAIIDGIFNLVWALVFIALLFSFFKILRFIAKKQKEDKHNFDWHWDHPKQIVIVIIGTVISIIGLIAIPILLENAATALINTDFYIVNYLLDKIS